MTALRQGQKRPGSVHVRVSARLSVLVLPECDFASPDGGCCGTKMPPRGHVSERPIRMQKICGRTRHFGRHFIARDEQSLQLEASGRSDDRASRLSDALLSGWFGGGSAKEPTSGPVTEAEMARGSIP